MLLELYSEPQVKMGEIRTRLFLLFLHATLLIQENEAAHEHRVHNIMLYPEKHSWCKLTPITQVITHVGCKSKEIENHVCVGACFSFSVPRTVPETPGDDKLYYCDSCQPKNVTWRNVNLECSDSAESRISKMVEIISDCSCRPCSGKFNAVTTNDSLGLSKDVSEMVAAVVNSGSSGSGDGDADEHPRSGSEESEEEEDEENDADGNEEDGEELLPRPGLRLPIPHTQVILHKTVIKDKTIDEGPTANLIEDRPISEREEILKQMKEKNPEQLKVLGEQEDDDEVDGAVPMEKV